MLICSFFSLSVLLNVEIFDLVLFFARSDNIQELSQVVLLQIFLSHVLEVAFGEVDGSIYCDFAIVVANFHLIAQLSDLSIDLNSLP